MSLSYTVHPFLVSTKGKMWVKYNGNVFDGDIFKRTFYLKHTRYNATLENFCSKKGHNAR